MNRILWDVLEDHLEEGAFEFLRWQRASVSPAYVLDEVADDVELALWIHLQAISLPGAPAFEQLIAPPLAAPDEADLDLLGFIALAAVSLGRLDALRPVVLDGSAEVFEAVLPALELHPDPALDRWSQQLALQVKSGPARARVLRLAAARCIAAEPLDDSLHSKDAAELTAAAHALRWAPRERYQRQAEQVAEHGAPDARAAASLALLQWQSAHGLRACRELVEQKAGSAAATAMTLLGLFGGKREHALLTDALGDVLLAPDAIRALGLSGNPAVVEPLLDQLESPDERTRRLAGEAFSLITGFDLSETSQHAASEPVDEDEEAERALPDLEDDDLEASLVPSAADELPLVDVQAARRFWSERGASLDRDRRHLAGDANVKRALLAQLRHGRMRDRHPLALSLALRTSGRYELKTRSVARMQQRWLSSAGELPGVQLSTWVMDW